MSDAQFAAGIYEVLERSAAELDVHHIDIPMKIIPDLLRRGMAADNVMAALAQMDRSAVQAGRNDPCPCGSAKRFKRCHGAPQTSTA
jgi:uncharacterized protein YecA (UPF0149 family)